MRLPNFDSALWWTMTAWVILALYCESFLSLARGQSNSSTPATQPAESVKQQFEFEYHVKAAYLYSFGRYIQWPGSAFPPQEDAFVICLFGEDPFGDILNVISKTKTIQGHRIVVQTTSSLKALTHCHILFIPRTIQPELQFQIINELQDLPILVVGESPGFVKHGGCVNFYMDGDQVRFEINSDSIRQKKLFVDAKLLNLGKRVSE
jgi:hypothetical protein